MNELMISGKVDDFVESSAYHVFDGCGLFYNVLWPKIGTIYDLCGVFLQSLQSKSEKGMGVSVLFDYYMLQTTKDPEQKRRKQSHSTIEVNVNMNTPIPTDRKKFLSSKDNKQKHIEVFSSMLMLEGITVKHAIDDGDADTIIMKEVLSKSQEHDTVIVHSIDTDIFIGLLYHAGCNGENDIIMATKQGLVSIVKVCSGIDPAMKDCLLLAHAISGCDTVSVTYGVGKLKAYQKLMEIDIWQKSMNIIGKQEVSLDEVIDSGEKFFMQLYGKPAKYSSSLDHLREIFYILPKYIPISRVPQTSRAFRFRMLRVHLQVNTWMYLGKTCEEKHGFKKDDNGCFIPIITDKAVAPPYILQDIKCSCHVPNRAGLLCIGCGCHKMGLSCNALCKCSGECENI